MSNYHVADIIARIKNALQRRKATVTLPNTQFVYAFMTCLVNEGYIEKFSSSDLCVNPSANGTAILRHGQLGDAAGRGRVADSFGPKTRRVLTSSTYGVAESEVEAPQEPSSELQGHVVPTYLTVTFTKAQKRKQRNSSPHRPAAPQEPSSSRRSEFPSDRRTRDTTSLQFGSAAQQNFPRAEEKFERLIPVLTSLVCVSRPGTRVYVKKNMITPVLGGLGTHILSTSKGLMSSRQAIKLNVGGELLCTLW